MSYGQKPTNAWARQGLPSHLTSFCNRFYSLAPQITPGPNVFTSQALGLAAGQPFGGMAPMPGMPSINALVNQAAFSNMNVLAAQRPHIIQQQVAPQQQQRQPMQPEKNQRTFVGTITKLMETYGFVDDDVFFQTTYQLAAFTIIIDRPQCFLVLYVEQPLKWEIELWLKQHSIQICHLNGMHFAFN